MIREIENVFASLHGYRCFGCDPSNDLGLKIRLFADDEKGEVFTRITAGDHFSGFPGVLHGGIHCALIDEIGFWAMFDKVNKIGVTVKINMEFFNTGDYSPSLKRGASAPIGDTKLSPSSLILQDALKSLSRTI